MAVMATWAHRAVYATVDRQHSGMLHASYLSIYYVQRLAAARRGGRCPVPGGRRPPGRRGADGRLRALPGAAAVRAQ